MSNGDRRVAVVASQFGSCGSFELKSQQKATLLAIKEPIALTGVEKVSQDNSRMLFGSIYVAFDRGLRCDGLSIASMTSLVNRPSESASSDLPCDGERKVRPPGTQFLGIEEFQENRKDVLRDVITRKRGKGCGNLAGSAVNGRNKGQQKKFLSNGTQRGVVVSTYDFVDDLIDESIPVWGAVVVKFLN